MNRRDMLKGMLGGPLALVSVGVARAIDLTPNTTSVAAQIAEDDSLSALPDRFNDHAVRIDALSGNWQPYLDRLVETRDCVDEIRWIDRPDKTYDQIRFGLHKPTRYSVTYDVPNSRATFFDTERFILSCLTDFARSAGRRDR